MKTFKLATLVFVTVLTSACVQSQHNQKQTIGTLLGAGAGALLGSQVGGGKGQLAAVAIGALGGAFAFGTPAAAALALGLNGSASLTANHTAGLMLPHDASTAGMKSHLQGGELTDAAAMALPNTGILFAVDAVPPNGTSEYAFHRAVSDVIE